MGEAASSNAGTGEILHFQAIKEPRGSYFVEYQPPGPHGPFAVLSIIFHDALPDRQTIYTLVETELRQWLLRYPVPIMAMAFDATNNSIQIGSSQDDHHVVGWIAATSGEVICSWELGDLDKHVEKHLPPADWRTIYPGVPFKTAQDIKADAERYVRDTQGKRRSLLVVLTVWVAVLPATWATLQYLGPKWLSAAVFAFTLWKIQSAWRKMMGYLKPSPSEAKKSEKQRKMDHYYYHCERNPVGFARLKVENLDADIKKRTQDEALSLRRQS